MHNICKTMKLIADSLKLGSLVLAIFCAGVIYGQYKMPIPAPPQLARYDNALPDYSDIDALVDAEQADFDDSSFIAPTKKPNQLR